MADVRRWHAIQARCPGGDVHEDCPPCPGGEWRDEMSLAWFSEPGRQREALDLFRSEEKDPASVRMVERTETVLDL